MDLSKEIKKVMLPLSILTILNIAIFNQITYSNKDRLFTLGVWFIDVVIYVCLTYYYKNYSIIYILNQLKHKIK